MSDHEVDDGGNDQDSQGLRGCLLESLLVLILCKHISKHDGLSVVAELGWEFHHFFLFLAGRNGAEMALTKGGREGQNRRQWCIGVSCQFSLLLLAGEGGLSLLPVDRQVDEEIAFFKLAAELDGTWLSIIEFVVYQLVWCQRALLFRTSENLGL